MTDAAPIAAPEAEPEAAPVVAIDGLVKTRRDSERTFTLEVPHLALAAGDRVALVGSSGSGKSTLIALLALATGPDEARRFALWPTPSGAPLDAAAAWRRGDERLLTEARARAIAYVPQRDGLMEFLTVEQNVRTAAELAGADGTRDLAGIVEALGLGAVRAAHPARLSGGQRQRAAVACALARNPRLVLADEPTAALDAGNAARVMESLVELAAARGAAIVFATHQLGLVADYGFTVLAAETRGANGTWHATFAPR